MVLVGMQTYNCFSPFSTGLQNLMKYLCNDFKILTLIQYVEWWMFIAVNFFLSGNRCILFQHMSLDGKRIIHSHAEIMARRAFMRYLGGATTTKILSPFLPSQNPNIKKGGITSDSQKKMK